MSTPTPPVTTHHIAPEHKPQLARLQHVLEWLQSEQQRLQQELAHVARQGQRADAQLRSILLTGYGIAPHQPFTLDVDGTGTVTTPDDETSIGAVPVPPVADTATPAAKSPRIRRSPAAPSPSARRRGSPSQP